MTILNKLMNFIKINGITHQVKGEEIEIKNNKVYVGENISNMKVIATIRELDLKIEWSGPLASLRVSKGSVTCGNVEGDVDAGDSVSCDSVGGSIDAGDSVTCDDVGGDVSAGSDVTCGNVAGAVDAEGSVTCGSVGHYVDCGDSATCGNVGEYVNSGGDVVCGNVGDYVESEGGTVSCKSVSGDINNADTVNVTR